VKNAKGHSLGSQRTQNNHSIFHIIAFRIYVSGSKWVATATLNIQSGIKTSEMNEQLSETSQLI
jgi:hypothetical protein